MNLLDQLATRVLKSEWMPRESRRAVTTDAIRERAAASFGDIYFVLLAIFQSIVAAKLFDRFWEMQDLWRSVPNFTVVSLHFFVSASLIVCVMFSYWWWVIFVRARPHTRDILLPLGMGFC